MKKLLLLFSITAILFGCNKAKDPNDNPIYPGGGEFSGQIFSSSQYYTRGAEVVIDGHGLDAGCNVGLRAVETSGGLISVDIVERSMDRIVFTVPASLEYGTYIVLLINESDKNQTMECGRITLLPPFSEAPKTGTIEFTNISDANTLYVTASGSSATAALRGAGVVAHQSAGSGFFKITANNKTEQVVFTSESGDTIKDVSVNYFRNMSEKYLYVRYNCVERYDTMVHSMHHGLIGNIKDVDINGVVTKSGGSSAAFWSRLRGGQDEPNNEIPSDPILPPVEPADSIWYEYVPTYAYDVQVIVRKTDNAVFKINPTDIATFSIRIDAETLFQVDYNENVYFTNSGGGGDLLKIYTHGKEVYIKKVNNNVWLSADWLVDRRGNVLINSMYARLVSDEFTRMPENAYDNMLLNFFINYNDSEGFIKLRGERGEWNSATDRYHHNFYIDGMTAVAPTMTVAQQKHLEVISALPGQNEIIYKNANYMQYNPFGVYVYKDKTVISRLSHKPGESWIVTLKNKNDITETVLPDLQFPENMVFSYFGTRFPCTEKYLYGMSRSEIWRLEIETGNAELMYKYDAEFDIKNINVKNGIITFYAFELRRAMDVVGEIYPDKTVKIIESVNNDKILYLERIN